MKKLCFCMKYRKMKRLSINIMFYAKDTCFSTFAVYINGSKRASVQFRVPYMGKLKEVMIPNLYSSFSKASPNRHNCGRILKKCSPYKCHTVLSKRFYRNVFLTAIAL